MVNFAVFNELSLPFSTAVNINEKFIDFFKLLNELKKKGLTSLRVSGDFRNEKVLPNISFQQFLGQQVDRDFQRKLHSFLVNGYITIDSPIIKEGDENEANIINNCEYFYKNFATVGGLACSDVWNTIAISFNSDNEWATNRVSLRKEALINDSEIEQQNIEIKHASEVMHLIDDQDFFDDLEKEIQLGIQQYSFWINRNSFFPNIIVFCPEVESQLKELDSLIFRQAVSMLRDIETNRKLIIDFKHSGEGETVRNTPKLNKVRMFTVQGEKIFFGNHIKSLPNANRIHYLEKEGRIYIGYIGKHLPTKRDQ